MNTRPAFVAALVAIAWLSGCLAVPLSEPKVLEGAEVTPEQLEFLAAGVTTRDEVVERLGQPDIEWEDARVFSYDWDMRWGVLIWAVGGYSVGYVGITDIPVHHLLLIEFDEDWRVRRFEHVVRDELKPYSDLLLEWKAASDRTCVSAGPVQSGNAR